MSRQSEERNRLRFAEKMREKSLAAKKSKLTAKKAPGAVAPAGGAAEGQEDSSGRNPEGNKKD